jgi:hypothetical protein
VKFQPCSVNTKNSCWIFVSGSTEDRHLYDIVIGIDCLRKKGVADDNIFVFKDHPERYVHLPLYSITKDVHTTADLKATLPQIKGFEVAVTVAGEHGSPLGITVHGANVTPQELIDSIRSIPGIKAGVAVLGQCYAGLFNFTNAGSEDPQLVIIISTNLNPSLSDSITLQQPIQETDREVLQSWAANVFLLYFVMWLKNAVDVDDDGKFNLMDAYKFSGVHSNEHLRSIKSSLHFGVEVLKPSQMQVLSKAPASPDAAFLLKVHSVQRQINMAVDQLYLHQEPWILHSNFASEVTFCVIQHLPKK